jgi:hypothetical protein
MELVLTNGTSQRLIDLLKDRGGVVLDESITDPRRRAFVFTDCALFNYFF